nr:MAG: hypothetical protein [Betatorquevirus sp.]
MAERARNLKIFYFTDMYSLWKNQSYSKRQLELQWINATNNIHDLFCHCDNPTFHLLYCINKFSSAQKPETDLRNIQCLLTGERIATEDTNKEDAGDPTGFLDGELEDLFKEEDTEEKDTPTER